MVSKYGIQILVNVILLHLSMAVQTQRQTTTILQLLVTMGLVNSIAQIRALVMMEIVAMELKHGTEIYVIV